MRTLIICIALFFFSTLIHAQEIEIPSKYGSASEQAKELMKKNNVIMSQECGNITVTIGGNTKTKLIVTGNALVATANKGKDLLVFSYETYDDTVTIYSINYKTQRFSILQPPTFKSLDFKDCNCDDEFEVKILQSIYKLQILNNGSISTCMVDTSTGTLSITKNQEASKDLGNHAVGNAALRVSRYKINGHLPKIRASATIFGRCSSRYSKKRSDFLIYFCILYYIVLCTSLLMTHLNYYDKDHRAILRRTTHFVSLAIKTNTKADLETVLLNNTFFATELKDLISHVHGNKKREKKLASILTQLVSTISVLKKYECEASRELQLYIYDTLRIYFKIPSSEDLPQN